MSDNINVAQLAPIVIGVISLIILMGFLGYGLLSGESRGSSKYKKYKSLDKFYDDAGGNEPLSNAQMITNIDLSTDKNSCSFIVTHKGNKGRTVECMSGCSNDLEDENSNFCKQYIYPGGDDELKDTLLDDIYIRRRDAARNNNK